MPKETSNGRLVVTQHEVRSAVYSATASITTGSPTSFIAGDSAYFNDIIEISASNDSTVAAIITLVDDGSRIRTMSIPASATAQLYFDAPLKQGVKGSNWNIDGADITGTTITVDATYIKSN